MWRTKSGPGPLIMDMLVANPTVTYPGVDPSLSKSIEVLSTSNRTSSGLPSATKVRLISIVANGCAGCVQIWPIFSRSIGSLSDVQPGSEGKSICPSASLSVVSPHSAQNTLAAVAVNDLLAALTSVSVEATVTVFANVALQAIAE